MVGVVDEVIDGVDVVVEVVGVFVLDFYVVLVVVG